jgi:hypothetical protein
MHEIDINTRIRELCQQILDEQDPSRLNELMSSLRTTVKAEQEEARVRMSYVVKHFRGRLQSVEGESPKRHLPERRLVKCRHAAEPPTKKGTAIRALLDFLGIGPGMKLRQEV